MSARVLVVDDLLPNVKLMAAKLSSEYFEVLTATSGPEALEKVKSSSPDIVLLDVMMPGMDGFEVCTRLKADPETMNVPVVMVTALSDSENRVRGLEAGADDFLTKPVNDIALFARVRSLVRLKITFDQWRLRENTSGQFGVLQNTISARTESHELARILLVEDCVTDCDRITTTLARDRNTVVRVTTCAEAFERAKSERFDLIMVSLTLAEEDGLRLCSQLRSSEKTRQMPVLLVADDADLKRIAKGLELGANDYVLRPIDRNEVLARVRSQIRQKRYQDRLQANYEANLAMALTDSLTGLYNRRYVMAHLEKLMDRNNEIKKRFAILMFDIDYFKKVNDTYGHASGDDVLREFAARISASMRNFDLIGRVGGEEFIGVLPDTNLETALMVAERLRVSIADRPFPISGVGGPIKVTTSIGLTLADVGGDTVNDVLQRADEALYAAKHNGRNRLEQKLIEGEKPAA
jgi:two-component system cell cycle response regulator